MSICISPEYCRVHDLPWEGLDISETIFTPSGTSEPIPILEANFENVIQTLGLVQITCNSRQRLSRLGENKKKSYVFWRMGHPRVQIY